VTEKKRKVTVWGCRCITGELKSHLKYRVMRDEDVVANKVTIHNLKHLKKNVSSIEKGMECGISFNSFDEEGDLMQGDIVECVEEVEQDTFKFEFKAGVTKTF
jgi:translation initiation factor IF-2